MDTRPDEAAERNNRRLRLWPYRRATALLGSLLLLLVLLLGLSGLWQVNALPDDRISGWLLLGAVLLSLVPIFLSILDLVAERAGTVEAPGGVKISFTAVEASARVDVSRTTISGNLGVTPPGMSVADTGGTTILETLKPVLGSDVAVLDLGEGQEWWQTRLLLLTSGAARLGNPRVLVFTATVSGRTKQFVAWGTPGELLRVHLSNSSRQMQVAYRRAQALAGQWLLGEPTPAGNSVTYPWPTPGGTTAATASRPGIPPPQLIPEQFLLTQLSFLEPPSPEPMTDLAVTVPVLRGLFTAVLREDSVERDDSDERWRDAILGSADDYLAVTERGTYVSLVSRPAAINAVLRSLIR